MRLKWLAFTMLAALTLAGCGGLSYYNGKAYHNPEEALKAYRADLNDRLASIAPTGNRIGGKALVALPNTAILVEAFLSGAKENPPLFAPEDYEDDLPLTAARADAHYGFMADALKKRGVFDDVTVIRSDAPEKADIAGYDYLIYLSVPGPYKDQWYIRFGKNAPMPIYLDYSIERSPERDVRRTNAWLMSIEQLVAEVK